MEADGSDARTIVSDPAFDFGPWFSHDGTRFAFWRRVSDSDVAVMVANVDGSGIRSLSGSPLTDADWYEWSPGDDQLAVVHARNGQRVITILDAKGSAPPLDVNLGDLDVDNNVYWVPPNGDELIFSARQTPDHKDVGLYAVKRDGTDLRMVGPVRTEHYFDLAVAPDGSTVAFSNIESDSSGNGVGWHIHMRDLRTGADRQLTFDPRASGEIDEHGPVFSPDGQQLLMWTQDGDYAQLVVAARDASTRVRPLGPRFYWDSNYNYSFAPDGRTAILNLGISTTYLIDIASGRAEATDEPIRNFSGWQRLAPPLP
jgi:Tol biopolymer transport system component